jgi:hypothetical protein
MEHNRIEKQDYLQYFLVQRDPQIFGFNINVFGNFKKIVTFGILNVGQSLTTKAKFITLFETEEELRQRVNTIKNNSEYYDREVYPELFE